MALTKSLLRRAIVGLLLVVFSLVGMPFARAVPAATPTITSTQADLPVTAGPSRLTFAPDEAAPTARFVARSVQEIPDRVLTYDAPIHAYDSNPLAVQVGSGPVSRRGPPIGLATAPTGTSGSVPHGGDAAKAGSASKTFQTYTKVHPDTGAVYVGRTSGTGSPLENLARRDAGHAYNGAGFGPAQLDQSGSYSAIRGREQQLIEYYRDLGVSANKINGISPFNPRLDSYMSDAFSEFGAIR